MNDDFKETASSRCNRTNAHVNSERAWMHAKDLHRLKPDGVLFLRGGNGHGPTPIQEATYN